MGKRGNWFSSVKKALAPDSKKITRAKTNCFGKQNSLNHDSSPVENPSHAPADSPPIEHKCKETPLEEDLDQHVDSHPQQELVHEDVPSAEEVASAEEFKRIEAENEQNKHAYSIALATAAVAEAAIVASQISAEAARLTAIVRSFDKLTEEEAAIRIQAAFRRFMARRALRTLRGLVRLRCMMQGKYVERQAKNTLRCMQTLIRVRSQIRVRRVRMSQENQALERQLQEKREKEIENLKASVAGGNWNDSTQSKEQVEAKLLKKQEAAMRREKALAYAQSHQIGKNSSKSTNPPPITEPSNPYWGWSWLERWMATRPWENGELSSDKAYIKKAISRRRSIGDANKVTVSRGLSCDNNPSANSPKPRCFPRKRSLSSPPTKSPSLASKTRRASPKGSCSEKSDDNGDSISIVTSKSEMNSHVRRSSTGSSERDCDSLLSSSVTKKVTTAKPRVYSAPANGRSRRNLSLPSVVGTKKHSTITKLDYNSVPKRVISN